MKVLINEASFSLPAKAFNIDFAVVEKRQLPVVKEFVVRFIYSIEQCNPELIANFFGFKANEITDVLEDLEIEGLICWEDGDVFNKIMNLCHLSAFYYLFPINQIFWNILV